MTDQRETYERQAERWALERQECLDRAKPYVPGEYAPGAFSVRARDTHHFDISAPRRPGYVQWYFAKNPTGMCYPPPYDGKAERAFCIRGDPGHIYVRDERWDKDRPHPRDPLRFPSVESAMAWITATLLIGHDDD